jgi:hypothetical protein
MKKTASTISIMLISLLFCSCGGRVDFGERSEGIAKAKIEEIAADPPSFADDTVRVGGRLTKSNGVFFLESNESALLLFPVGFAIADSLNGRRSVACGMVFYHEEMQMPGIAANYLSVRGIR